MTRVKFSKIVELARSTPETIITLWQIDPGQRFYKTRFTVKCIELVETAGLYASFSLQVGYNDIWATWVNITDVWHENKIKTIIEDTPAHPKFNKLRYRITLDPYQLPAGFKGIFEVTAEVEITKEEQEQPPTQPPEQPPEQPPSPPSPPSEPFNVGKWLEYALRKILRDEEPPSCNPANTRLLVSILATIYIATLATFSKWAAILGLVPIPNIFFGQPWRLFTYMWLHAPIVETINGMVVPHAHIAFNVLFLWVFGDNVECRLGHGKYLAYYLICGLLAGLGEVLWLHIIGEGFKPIVIIGASGAISGIMGLYLSFFPKNHVITFGKRLPAWNFLILWFLGQIALLFNVSGTVAVAAHITGFLAGVVLGEAEKHAEREIS
ncbi:MAG: rhomboid family intramembrane serine protease [Candidatus Freyarchaeota archaeon]